MENCQKETSGIRRGSGQINLTEFMLKAGWGDHIPRVGGEEFDDNGV